MNIDTEIKRFKMDLLRKMPFYGDIVMRLPFIENNSISTACTDGGKIEYNSDFLCGLDRGERNFVLMHEVFHVLLFHCKRRAGRDPKLWNTAADLIVNNMLSRLSSDMSAASIPFAKPSGLISAKLEDGETTENVYEQLLRDNDVNNTTNMILLRLKYFGSTALVENIAPDDIVIRKDGATEGHMIADVDLSEKAGLGEAMIKQIIRDAATANRSNVGSYFIPDRFFTLTESKRIKWDKLLCDFLVEEISDEASYTTPERKYIHMDLILPGYGKSDGKIEEIWAFVDSSGSIDKNEMEQFLTQLYRISKEFKCVFNICYWDTTVTDVYKKIIKEDDILKSLPRHFGGTDINCVYKYIKEKKIKPDIMLILTDGYFGTLDKSLISPSLAKKTILVLSTLVKADDDMKRIGKITRL